jgi:hypothetical protein
VEQEVANMRSAKQSRIVEAVRPYLAPGEQVRLVTQAGVGQVSVKRQIGVGVAVAVVSLGQLTAIAQPRTFVLILTDRQLLFVEPSSVRRNGVGEIALALNLSGLRTKRYRGLSLNKRFDLEADDMPPLRLNFPLSGGSDAQAVRAAVDGGA